MGSKLTLHLSHRALQDLGAIWDYIFQTYGIEQAEQYTGRIEQTCELLCGMPLMAREVTWLSQSVRVKTSGEHLIAYQLRDDVLFVIRVLHARSDWQSLLSD